METRSYSAAAEQGGETERTPHCMQACHLGSHAAAARQQGTACSPVPQISCTAPCPAPAAPDTRHVISHLQQARDHTHSADRHLLPPPAEGRERGGTVAGGQLGSLGRGRGARRGRRLGRCRPYSMPLYLLSTHNAARCSTAAAQAMPRKQLHSQPKVARVRHHAHRRPHWSVVVERLAHALKRGGCREHAVVETTRANVRGGCSGVGAGWACRPSATACRAAAVPKLHSRRRCCACNGGQTHNEPQCQHK